jgi:hypothetical protein
MRFLATIAVLAALTGCMATAVKITAPFDAAQAQTLLAPGKNTITGSALIKRQDGIAVTCAGAEVQLIPATAYATQRITAIYGNAERGRARNRVEFDNNDPAYQSLIRKTTCNAQGFFTFREVADGEFFILTSVVWTVGYNTQGGHLMQRVRVTGGQTQEVVLAP